MYLYFIAYIHSYFLGLDQQTTYGNLEYELDHKLGTRKDDLTDLCAFVDQETEHSCTIMNIMFISKS